MKPAIIIALTALYLAIGSLNANALDTAPLFTDHMVLQRGKNIPVWGTASPGEPVSVTLGSRTAKTFADTNGQWKAVLKSVNSPGPYTMTVTGQKESRKFEDVLVGEVWLCSGQSNMELPLSDVNNGKEEIAAADHPTLRLFTVVKAVSDKPEAACRGSWAPCSPKPVSQFSAAGYFFGRELQKALHGVPVGLIDSTWGGTPIEVWMSDKALRSNRAFAGAVGTRDAMAAKPVDPALEQKVVDWTRAAETLVLEGQFEGWYPGQPFSGGRRDPLMPTGLYNAMIHPLAPYPIRGVIWYQGEANTASGVVYRQLFPAMIQDWRTLWGQGDFPFLYVQLANFITDPKYPVMRTGWPVIQEAQLMSLAVKNTAMAVTIDIGAPNDIHPRNKQDLGKRLALAAEATVYHQRIPYSGPIYKSMKFVHGKIELSFTHTGGGLVARDGALKGFVIAGADRQFVPAQAEIRGKRILVWSDTVPNPTAARYAWDDNPEATLFNKAGLPASPFRTDRDSKD
ncbi:MAG: sialate O-acetylesterase [Candidatus Hydrogenedentes bacterium]|nr:sialate O-acetylesterase [Candidatus Hydrogenedentota bacterium]